MSNTETPLERTTSTAALIAAAVLAALAALLTTTASAAFAAADHRPNARADAYSTQEDTLLSVTRARGVLKNDSDRDGNRLIARLTRATDHGSIRLSKDGSFMYDPADNFNGNDSFAYKACEAAHPKVCSYAAYVSLKVDAVNDAPLVTGDHLRVKVGRIKTLSAPGLLANDADPDGDALHVAFYTQPRGGRLHVGPGGSVRFVPDRGFYGKTYFRYWAADDGGLTDDAIVTVRVFR